jgi:hypothetical protein
MSASVAGSLGPVMAHPFSSFLFVLIDWSCVAVANPIQNGVTFGNLTAVIAVSTLNHSKKPPMLILLFHVQNPAGFGKTRLQLGAWPFVLPGNSLRLVS